MPMATVASGTAKAWVNFNGTGTVAIRAAFNVTSITDNGTGNYTVNFTTAMPDANYSVTGITGNFNGGEPGGLSVPTNPVRTGAPIEKTALAVRVYTSVTNSGGGFYDYSEINVAIFR